MRNVRQCGIGLVAWLCSSLGAGGEPTPEEYFEIVAACDRLLPRAAFDLPACALECGTGWEGAWRLVRDGVRYVPYEGSQRGAEGTLASREGNSLDQALLLGALLEHQGFRTRLCSAALPEERRLALEKPHERGDRPRPAELARITGIAPEDLQGYLTARKERGRALTAFLLARTEARVSQLEGVLGPPPAAEPAPGETTHFWLQAETTPGTWQDLDPSARLEPGKRLAEPQRQFTAGELPDRLVTTVSLKLSLEKTELLSYTAAASAVGMKTVSLGFMPVDSAFWSSSRKGPAEARAAYRKVERFQPLLAVGTEYRPGRHFDLAGRVYKNVGDGRIDAAKKLGGGIGGLFGGGRKQEDTGPASWHITLEVTIAGPAESRAFTRELVSPGTSEELRIQLLSNQTLLLAPGAVSPDAVAHRRLDHLLRNRDVILSAMKGSFSTEKDWNRVSGEPLPLLAFLLAETAVFDMLEQRDAVFVPLHLVAWDRRSRLVTPPGGGEAQMRTAEGFDIMCAPIGTSLSGAKRAALGLRWGVLVTELERLILEMAGEAGVANAGRSFYRAAANEIPLSVLRREDDLAGVEIPEGLRATVAAELARGMLIVIPARPAGAGPQGYYAVDPRSGETLGRLAGFRGQAMTEYAANVDIAMSAMGTFQSFADFMKCLVGTMTGALAGKTQAVIRVEFCQCFISWAYGAFTGGIKGLFDIDPSWGSIGVDVVTGGMPGTDFGGFNGAIGKAIAKNACGG